MAVAAALTLDKALLGLTATITNFTNVARGRGGIFSGAVGGAALGGMVGGNVGGLVGAGIGAAIGGLNTAVGLVGTIASYFNAPSTVIFKNTLNDIRGVIGNTLTPIFRIFNTTARFVGDTLATVAPRFYGLFENLERGFIKIKPVFDDIQNTVIALVDSFTTWVEEIFSTETNVNSLRNAIRELGRAAVVSAEFLRNSSRETKNVSDWWLLLGPFGKFFGGMVQSAKQWSQIVSNADNLIDQATRTPRRSSVGAGMYTASHTDVESYEKKLREAAFSMGQGIAAEKEEREKNNAKLLQSIKENTDPLKEHLPKLKGIVDEALRDAILGQDHGMRRDF